MNSRDVESPETIAGMMSQASEEFFCAGWLIGLEFELWARVVQYRRTGRCSSWGLGDWTVTTDMIADLSTLSAETNTWAYWDEDTHTDRIVTVEEWETSLWPHARPAIHALADSFPLCGMFGELVEDDLFGHFLRCALPAGHQGDHHWTDIPMM